MGHIFISYSRRDAEYVDAIIKRFEKAGLSVWVDRGSIQGGDQWKQEIVEGIEKPGNLGSLLRSADAAGADGLIICNKCTDIYNPNVIRASTGALFAVPVAEATNEETLEWLTKNNIKTLAGTPHTDIIYSKNDMTKATAILVGAEQYGLTEFWMNKADQQVKIPMLGKIDSLNVATAATILLYEAARQRDWK